MEVVKLSAENDRLREQARNLQTTCRDAEQRLVTALKAVQEMKQQQPVSQYLN